MNRMLVFRRARMQDISEIQEGSSPERLGISCRPDVPGTRPAHTQKPIQTPFTSKTNDFLVAKFVILVGHNPAYVQPLELRDSVRTSQTRRTQRIPAQRGKNA